MTAPLIILGAGASHDFTHPGELGVVNHSERTVFPLTDDLIRLVDREIEARYSGFKTMRSLVQSSVFSKRKTFEECIKDWEDYEQRTALLLYLSDYFYKKSNDPQIEKFSNNFIALIDLIRKSQAKAANIITFNYDLLLEKAIDPTLNKFTHLPDYINDSIRVIKIHGSCDWFTLMRKISANEDMYATLKKHPEYFEQPRKDIQTARWLERERSQLARFFFVPRISIPTTFTKSYSCPEEHIKILEDSLLSTKKILIIGWKASDTFLLEKLKIIKSPISLTVVSGTKAHAAEIAHIVKKYVAVDKEILLEHFSNFIGSDECTDFFL